MENIKNFYKNISNNFNKEKDSLDDGQIILSKTDQREIAIGAEYERESSLDSIINKMLQLDSESKRLYIKTFVSTLIRENEILSRGISKQVFAFYTNSQGEISCDPIFSLITSNKQNDSEIKQIIYSELIEIETAIQEDKILYYKNGIVCNDLKQHLSQVIDWIKEAIDQETAFYGSNYSYILQDMIHNELKLKHDTFSLSFNQRYYYEGKDISDYINEVKTFNNKIYDDFINIDIDLKTIAKHDQYQIFGWEWDGSIYQKDDDNFISKREQTQTRQKNKRSELTQKQLILLFQELEKTKVFDTNENRTILSEAINLLTGLSIEKTRQAASYSSLKVKVSDYEIIILKLEETMENLKKEVKLMQNK